jgi:putative sigma-54 modulation protein
MSEEAPLPAEAGRIIKNKRFELKPMSPDEAAMQMELLDKDFFVFTNDNSGEINVIYRRRDGNFGLIEPVK